jgi:hypothetical protein
LPCIAALTLARLDGDGRPRALGPAAFGLVAIAFAHNHAIGASEGALRARAADGFARAAWIGVTPSTLAAEWTALDPGDETPLERRVWALRRGGFPPFDLSDEERDRRLRPFYRSLSGLQTTPDGIRSEGLVDASRCDGADAVLVHAPGMLRYRVEAGRVRVRGRFGVCPGAWRDGGATDGVRFRVLAPDHEVPVFERHLRPVEAPGDRGPQPLDVTIDVGEAGDLVLRAGSAGTPNWDWSYWAGIRVER